MSRDDDDDVDFSIVMGPVESDGGDQGSRRTQKKKKRKTEPSSLDHGQLDLLLSTKETTQVNKKESKAQIEKKLAVAEGLLKQTESHAKELKDAHEAIIAEKDKQIQLLRREREEITVLYRKQIEALETSLKSYQQQSNDATGYAAKLVDKTLTATHKQAQDAFSLAHSVVTSVSTISAQERSGFGFDEKKLLRLLPSTELAQLEDCESYNQTLIQHLSKNITNERVLEEKKTEVKKMLDDLDQEIKLLDASTGPTTTTGAERQPSDKEKEKEIEERVKKLKIYRRALHDQQMMLNRAKKIVARASASSSSVAPAAGSSG
jgi:hypothetical protein